MQKKYSNSQDEQFSATYSEQQQGLQYPQLRVASPVINIQEQ